MRKNVLFLLGMESQSTILVSQGANARTVPFMIQIHKHTLLINLLAFGISPKNLMAQTILSGQVLDAYLQNGITNAELSLTGKNVQVTTDSKGNFNFFIPSEGNEQDPTSGKIYTVGAKIYWEYPNAVEVSIYDLKGNRVLHYAGETNHGYLNMGHCPSAFYIVTIGRAKYRMFLPPNKAQINIELSRPSHAGNTLTDTLYVASEGYFTKNIPISIHKMDTILHIDLLKKQYPKLSYTRALPSKTAFNLLQSTPSKTHYGNVESLKIILDKKNQKAYYINTNLYNTHYDFAVDKLGYTTGHLHFNNTQYQHGPARYLFPLTLNYYKDLDVYTFEFFSGDGATCDEVNWCYHFLLQSSYLANMLYFYPTSTAWASCNAIPSKHPNDIFKGQNYQALNEAQNYGYLRKIEVNDVNAHHLNPNDIILVNGIPIDLPVVAGIITTKFQPPLSHINILSHNRKTPNMALKDGFENSHLHSLLNQLVYLKVSNDAFEIRKANLQEAEVFWKAHRPHEPSVAPKDVQNYGLVDLDKQSWKDVDKIGGKAANFAEMLHAFRHYGITPPVPENYFAIPFYYYDAHLKKAGLPSFIEHMLNDERFKQNQAYRKKLLWQLQDSILNTPIDPDLVQRVKEKMKNAPRFTSYRFRSSTNAEDLDGFNGAGLYSSFSAKLSEQSKKTVENAIRLVWASLWNFSAFEERSYFNIDHQSCAMGVLVHRSFPNEDANGVAITKNPYNINSGYLINAQHKDFSIVDPKPGMIHDQLVVYNFALSENRKYEIEYINTSNAFGANTKKVLTEAEINHLSDLLTMLKSYYYRQLKNPNTPYSNYAVDVEFKIDSELEERKIYIKQVRLY